MLHRPYEFLRHHPAFFSLVGVGVNLLARKSTHMIEKILHSTFDISPSASKTISAVKNVIDESFNQIFYAITFYYSLGFHKHVTIQYPSYKHMLFAHKAVASVVAAFSIQITEIALYKNWGLFLEPQTQYDLNTFLFRHSTGQNVKYLFLQSVSKSPTNNAIGGALLYGIRTSEDKFYFNDAKNLIEEFSKVILQTIKETQHYISSNSTSFRLSDEKTKININKFNKLINAKKATLTKAFEDTQDLKKVLTELMKHIKAEFNDTNLEPFLDKVFDLASANLHIIEENHANSNSYFAATDVVIGAFNSMAFGGFIFPTTPKSTELMIGARIRAVEAFAKFVRDEAFSHYIKAPYPIKPEDIISFPTVISNVTDTFKFPTCLPSEAPIFFDQPAILAPTCEAPFYHGNISPFDLYHALHNNNMCPMED